ncbi:hypothetical protein F5Y17DRAFT_223013 [Xylariaceae sp. FL0594]|nr:hypothetical protein F5Y17DRAFT_223013 [Xylariaceae sp. FL0594]
MARPRKRRHSVCADAESTKGPPRKKKRYSSRCVVDAKPQHPALSQFYPQVQTLREYVVSKLPPTSRIRRRKVSAIGIINGSPDQPFSDVEKSLGALLDTTLIGVPSVASEGEDRAERWKNFSQRGDKSYISLSDGVSGFAESQALIVEFVVRTIFNREKSSQFPDHLLCDGFRRDGGLGVRVARPNHRTTALQSSPWPELLALLGQSGDRIMVDLLLDCAIFVSVKAGSGNVCQVSASVGYTSLQS